MVKGLELEQGAGGRELRSFQEGALLRLVLEDITGPGFFDAERVADNTAKGEAARIVGALCDVAEGKTAFIAGVLL